MLKSFEIVKPLLLTIATDTATTMQPLSDSLPTDIHIILKDIAYILSIVYAIIKLYKESNHYQKKKNKQKAKQ